MMHALGTNENRFAEVLSRSIAVSLDVLNRDAELQTRTDRKYVLTPTQAADMAQRFADECSVLEIDGLRSFVYETTYYDTPDRRLYLDTARRRPFRFKVRVRRYADSDLSMLEVKTKNGRGRTVKYRTEVDHLQLAMLTTSMRAYVDECIDTDLTTMLLPVLQTSFRRTTLLSNSGDVRCTIDHGLRGTDPDGNAAVPDIIVLETKSENHASGIDHWLWSQGIRPARISKYATAMASLNPSLPANHWNRILGAHFRDAVELVSSSPSPSPN
jgi:hypothetical protein